MAESLEEKSFSSEDMKRVVELTQNATKILDGLKHPKKEVIRGTIHGLIDYKTIPEVVQMINALQKKYHALTGEIYRPETSKQEEISLYGQDGVQGRISI
jgi:hypothetical protein